MASSEYRQLHNEDNSTESNRCMKQPPPAEDRAPPEDSVIKNMLEFISAFDGNIPDLQKQVNKLKEITDSVEKIHRKATAGSLTGSAIGAAGGITTIRSQRGSAIGAAGGFTWILELILTLTGVGVGVAVAGGVTGAASNIINMIKQKTSREEIKAIVEAIQNKLSPMIESLREIDIRLNKSETADSTDPSTQNADPTDPSTRRAQIGFGVGRGAGYTAELLRLINIGEIGKVAAQVSRTVKAAGAVTGVLSALFLILDVVFIVKDAKELYDIHTDPKDGTGKSAVSKFIQEMKETVDHFNKILNQLQEVREQFHTEILSKLTET